MIFMDSDSGPSFAIASNMAYKRLVKGYSVDVSLHPDATICLTRGMARIGILAESWHTCMKLTHVVDQTLAGSPENLASGTAVVWANG